MPLRRSLDTRFAAFRALSHLLLLGLVALPGYAQVSLEPAPGARTRSKVLDGLQKCVRENAFVDGVSFADLGNRLAEAESTLAEATSAGEFAREVNAVLGSYGVSHLMLYDPALTSLAKRGTEVGAGFRAMPLPDGGRLVTLVLPDGPAERLGLEPGDVITAVDGIRVPSEGGDLYPFSRGGRLLPSTSDSRTIDWTRNGTALSGKLNYGSYQRSLALKLEWVRDDVAWITLNSFQDYEEQAVEEAFREVAARGARRLILDMRSNGGGREDYHLHLASMMVPAETPVFQSVRREGEALGRVPESDLEPYSGPVAVLLNGINGSAGEIFPAYLRSVRGAVLVGTRTNGAVLGGIYCQLHRGYRLLVPIKEVLPLDGQRIEGRGVQPDVELTPQETADDAVVLEKTLAALEPS